LDFLLPLATLLVLFWLLRVMEHWLHRHAFKVGWLITRRFETTTVLYYTFFLPGVFVNQVSMWLAAGVFNVRADREFQFPEKQEIGELKLNFVRLAKKAPALKLTVIHLTPLLVGLIFTWFVANSIYDLPGVIVVASANSENSLGLAVERLLRVPDFWLWTYFVFTISNTMMPSRASLRGWVPLALLVLVVTTLILLTGYGDAFGSVFAQPILDAVNAFSLLLALIIGVDAVAIVVLAIIENTIEVITGNTATFKNGKMLVMRRQELRTQQQAERLKEQKRREQQKAAPRPAGLPSVYALPFPLPGPPGSEPATMIVTPPKPVELDKARPKAPAVIETEAEVTSMDADVRPAGPVFGGRIGAGDADQGRGAAKPAVPARPAPVERDELPERSLLRPSTPASQPPPERPAAPRFAPGTAAPASRPVMPVRPVPDPDEPDDDLDDSDVVYEDLDDVLLGSDNFYDDYVDDDAPLDDESGTLG
jgi:hypothetical protein